MVCIIIRCWSGMGAIMQMLTVKVTPHPPPPPPPPSSCANNLSQEEMNRPHHVYMFQLQIIVSIRIEIIMHIKS